MDCRGLCADIALLSQHIRRACSYSNTRTVSDYAHHTIRRTSSVQDPQTVRTSKVEPRRVCGVWLGTIEPPDEHIVGKPRGSAKCRSAKPLPDTQRFSAEALDSMRGVPWGLFTLHAWDSNQGPHTGRGRRGAEWRRWRGRHPGAHG